ncbi:hypothetical protein G6011_07744 [Alternaria panax]|uniref:Uncharacterized protein n=1 Tax=Alternaria panax TaxID=48097 RepID=A0AAD4F8B5_9PLEO|nr:hypothetical protein G6011_07744 [Alternaria panax]
MILNNNNKCGFDVWIRQVIASEPTSRKRQGEDCGYMSGNEILKVKVGKGQKFVAPVPVLSHTFKVARRPADWQTSYQYEFNWPKDNGKIWQVNLRLSHLYIFCCSSHTS